MTIRQFCRSAAVSLGITGAIVGLGLALYSESPPGPEPVAYDGPAVTLDPADATKKVLVVPDADRHPVILVVPDGIDSPAP